MCIRDRLISEKDGLYNTYHEQKQRFRELQTVKRNIDQILRREEPVSYTHLDVYKRQVANVVEGIDNIGF